MAEGTEGTLQETTHYEFFCENSLLREALNYTDKVWHVPSALQPIYFVCKVQSIILQTLRSWFFCGFSKPVRASGNGG